MSLRLRGGQEGVHIQNIDSTDHDTNNANTTNIKESKYLPRRKENILTGTVKKKPPARKKTEKQEDPVNKPRTRSIREVMLLWQERDRLAKDKGEKEAATASLDSLAPPGITDNDRVEDELLTDRTVDVDEHEGLVDNVDKGNHLNFNLTRSRTLSRTRSTGHVPSCVNFNLSGTFL